MQIQLNDSIQMAVIAELDVDDLTEFNDQKGIIPDEYTVQILPPIADARVSDLGMAGRDLYFTQQTVYVTRQLDGGGYVSEPQLVVSQLLTPVKS